jgi:hypothetical protein
MLAFLGHDAREERLNRGASLGSVRQEYKSGPVFPRRRQGNANPRRLLAQETVGHLDQKAGAIAGVGFAAGRAAVLKVDEDVERLANDAVRAPAFDVDDKTDAAGIMFEGRVVKALSR